MSKEKRDELIELTRTLLIAQMGLVGVNSHSIRSLARCKMNRVSGVLKHLKTKKKKGK